MPSVNNAKTKMTGRAVVTVDLATGVPGYNLPTSIEAADYADAKAQALGNTQLQKVTVLDLGTFERTTETVTGVSGTDDPATANEHNPNIGDYVFRLAAGDFKLFRKIIDDRYTVPTGLTDYAAFLRDAIDLGLKLRFKAGTYPILSKIEKYLDYGIVDWIADGQAILDMSSLSASDAIGFRILSSVTTVNLANDIAEGARSITTTFAGLTAGDWLRITPHPDRISGGNAELWTAARSYYYKGELNQVVSYSGGIISLAKPARDAYTALNGSSQQNYILERVKTTKVSLKNIHFKRNANAFCAEFNRCNIEFENVTSEGGRECGIQYYYCRGKSFKGGGTDAWYSGSGQSYVAALASCEDFTLEKGEYNSGRHGITTGGLEPCRNITAEDLEAYSHPSSNQPGLDCHENSDGINFINVRTNGVAMAGRNLKLKDAKILSSLAGNVVSLTCTKSGGDYELDNVEIKGAIAGDSVRFQFGLDNMAADSLKIKNLKSKERTGIALYLTKNGKTGCSISDIDVNAQLKSAVQTIATEANFPARNVKLSGVYECTGANHAFQLNLDATYSIVHVAAVVRHLATNAFDAVQIQNALLAILENGDFDTTAQSGSRAAIRLTDTEQFRVEKCAIRNAFYGIRTEKSALASTKGSVKDNLYAGNAADRSPATGTTIYSYLSQTGLGIS